MKLLQTLLQNSTYTQSNHSRNDLMYLMRAKRLGRRACTGSAQGFL